MTLITGPGGRTEGDLLDRGSSNLGLKIVEVMGELESGRSGCGADLVGLPASLRAAFRRLEARSRPHAQLEGTGFSAGRPPGRASFPAIVHTIHCDAVRALRDPVAEYALCRAGTLGGAAVPRDRQRLRCDDEPGAWAAESVASQSA